MIDPLLSHASRLGKRGVFISFEGGEGTGKSTQAMLLQKSLQAAGIKAILTREPGGCDGSEQIRRLLLDAQYQWHPVTEVCLFLAARHQHWQQHILPALQAGTWVICDRFHDSTIAYQAVARGLGQDFIQQAYHWLLGNVQPDCSIILTADVRQSLARAKSAKQEFTHGDRFEQESLRFHQAIQQAFLSIAATNPHRCVVIDGNGRDIAPLHQEILSRLQQYLGLSLPATSLPHSESSSYSAINFVSYE